MSTRTSSHPRDVGPLRRTLRAPARAQTYRNLCYLALMFPLGVAYFVLLTTGFTVGVSLVVVAVGIPILLALLAMVVFLAGVERALVRTLLGVDAPAAPARTERSLRTRTKQLVTDAQTWKAVAYLFTEFFYGSVVVWLLASLVATSASFLFAPLYYERAPVVAYGTIPTTAFTLDLTFSWDNLLVGLTTTFRLGAWQVETLPGALLVAGLGGVLLLVSLQLANALAWLWGRYARIMLTTPRYWTTPEW